VIYHASTEIRTMPNDRQITLSRQPEPGDSDEPVVQRRRSSRRWWRDSSLRYFRKRIAKMNEPALRDLRDEVSGERCIVRSQLDAKDKEDDPDWYKRAKAALGFLVEYEKAASTELDRRKRQAEEPLPAGDSKKRILEQGRRAASKHMALTDLLQRVQKRRLTIEAAMVELLQILVKDSLRETMSTKV